MGYTTPLVSAFTMKTRLVLSLLALCFAFSVLAISLMDAHSVASRGEKTPSDRLLYFDKNMLPDHVLYPVFMIADRIHLETASKDERVFIEIDYANTRLLAGEELLNLQKEALAVTTFTKAEKYVYDAVQEYKDQKMGDSVKRLLIKVIDYHTRKLQELKGQMTDADRATIDHAIEQNTALLQELNN